MLSLCLSCRGARPGRKTVPPEEGRLRVLQAERDLVRELLGGWPPLAGVDCLLLFFLSILNKFFKFIMSTHFLVALRLLMGLRVSLDTAFA